MNTYHGTTIPDFTTLVQQIKANVGPDTRAHLAKDGTLNPLRRNTKFGHGNSGHHPFNTMSAEDVLFSTVNRKGDGIAMTRRMGDGTVDLVLPLGTPPDQVGKFKTHASQIEKREKIKVRLRKNLDKAKPQKRPRQQESVADYTARWKATAALLGEDEAARLQDAEFWEDGGYDMVAYTADGMD